MTGLAPGSEDTIAAQATAPGRGALSVIRVSGADAHRIARGVVERWPERPREAVLSAVRDGRGELLDRALVVRYDAPASYTGEDLVEISTHGGAVVPTTVLAALLAAGARQALPGEFTRRAVLNGKLDLVQAEAVGDLVDARSRAAQRGALHQLDGGLSRRLLALRGDVLAVEALVAYDIDFPEEDDGPIPRERIERAASRLVESLDDLLRTAPAGELVREGAMVVLAGAPNVGKSSLFNALLGRSRAIVTDVPGTTRDAIEAVVDAGRFPLRLVDTAGLRATEDVVERLGIEVSERYVRAAQVVLACGDDRASLERVIDAVESVGGEGVAPMIVVRTKADLGAERADADVAWARGRGREALAASAERGSGLAELVTTIERLVASGVGDVAPDAPMLTHARQRAGVSRAIEECRSFVAAWRDGGVPATIAAVHLRAAAGALEELIGRVDVEDVLDELFRRFCVGK